MDKIKKIMSSSCMNDFLRKLFVLFAILYLLFFGAETVLPGIVMDVLNINIFLFLIFAVLLYLKYFSDDTSDGCVVCVVKDLKKPLSILIVVFLSSVFVIALYRISLVESLVYLLFVLVVARMLYHFLEQ